MPTKESAKRWLKSKVGLPESPPPDSSSAEKPNPFALPERRFVPKPQVELPDHLMDYVSYLKQLYTDVTYDDLTATINHRNRTNFTAVEVEIWHTYLLDCRKSEHEMFLKIGAHRVAWFREFDGFDLEFCARQTDAEFNEPILDLARCRKEYDVAMAELGRSIPPNAPILQDDRTEDIKEISRWRKYPYRQKKMEDFRDLSAADLEWIYEFREKDRKEHCDKENLEYDYRSGLEPPRLR